MNANLKARVGNGALKKDASSAARGLAPSSSVQTRALAGLSS